MNKEQFEELLNKYPMRKVRFTKDVEFGGVRTFREGEVVEGRIVRAFVAHDLVERFVFIVENKAIDGYSEFGGISYRSVDLCTD